MKKRMKNYSFGKLWWLCFLSPFWGSLLQVLCYEERSAAYAFVDKAMVVCFLASPVFAILYLVTTKEEREVWYAEKQAAKCKKRERAEAEYNSPESVAKREDHRPISAVLISVEYRQSFLGGLGRAALGDWLMG